MEPAGIYATNLEFAADTYGNRRHHEQQYVVREDRVYETNSYGRIQHTTSRRGSSRRTGASSRWTPYGNKQLHKQQYKVKDRKVYETDAYGRVRRQKFEIKDEQGRSKSEVARR